MALINPVTCASNWLEFDKYISGVIIMRYACEENLIYFKLWRDMENYLKLQIHNYSSN